MQKKRGKDDALRNAKLDYLSSTTEPEVKSPYHWAGFVLMGDSTPVYQSTIPIGFIGLFGGMLLLGGFLFWIRMKSKAAQQ